MFNDDMNEIVDTLFSDLDNNLAVPMHQSEFLQPPLPLKSQSPLKLPTAPIEKRGLTGTNVSFKYDNGFFSTSTLGIVNRVPSRHRRKTPAAKQAQRLFPPIINTDCPKGLYQLHVEPPKPIFKIEHLPHRLDKASPIARGLLTRAIIDPGKRGVVSQPAIPLNPSCWAPRLPRLC